MTDETQQEGEQVRNAPPPPVPEADLEATAAAEADDDQAKDLAATIEAFSDLSDDELRELWESGDATDELRNAITLEIQARARQQLGVEEVLPELNAANRICVQLRRIADALGADTIPFDTEAEFVDDIERIERRLMDIVDALEGRSPHYVIPNTASKNQE